MLEMNAGLLDYGRGNLHSVEKALARNGAVVRRVREPKEAEGVDWLVLPGVGAFGDAMAALDERGLRDFLREWLEDERPFLGICLGYQLLFESSEESPGVRGLGWLPGRVVKFPAVVGKVPHMGWNEVRFRPSSGLEQAGGYYYHVHSYYPEGVPAELVACETEYGGIRFASGVRKGRMAAFQFHPEKSQKAGLDLLREVLAVAVPAQA